MSHGALVPLLGLAFTLGILIGSFLRWGSDRMELAAYRRISRDAERSLREEGLDQTIRNARSLLRDATVETRHP